MAEASVSWWLRNQKPQDMIAPANAMKLIQIYFHVCEEYESTLKYSCERMSPNQHQQLTDPEIISIYLYAVHVEQRFRVKQIHRYAKDHLIDWFPGLGSYAAFCSRLNRLSEAFRLLLDRLLADVPDGCSRSWAVLDSMPIITCSGKRSAKVAGEITDKTFCASKGMWYTGIKLHLLGMVCKGRLPHPEDIALTPASVNDLTLFKERWAHLTDRVFFGDRIYFDRPFFAAMRETCGSGMLTPVKHVKGTTEWEKRFFKAADDMYSAAVSSVRQPIESLFGWLIEKVDIQRASKVRSTAGLLVHVFAKLSAAFIGTIFNP
jgi:hypothetical protein